MLNIIGHRKIFFVASGILCLISIVSLSLWGLRPGIDFQGGTLAELEFVEERPSGEEIKEKLLRFDLGEIIPQPIGEGGMILRFKTVDEPTHQEILTSLGEFGEVHEKRFESIGPAVGQELRKKAIWAIALVIIAIIIYIAWAFRKLATISRKAGSWQYGAGATCALVHDILIICGIFSILGHFMAVEIGTSFIVALLTVLGYSVNDTIVIYDRARENLLKYRKRSFEENFNNSINESITRSLNTSLTTLFVLGAIYIFGGATIQNFALALILGAVVGTYSSIFIASPLLVVWQRIKRR